MRDETIVQLVGAMVPVILSVVSLVRSYCADRSALIARKEATRASRLARNGRLANEANSARLDTLESGSITKDMLLSAALADNTAADKAELESRRIWDGTERREEINTHGFEEERADSAGGSETGAVIHQHTRG